MVDELTMAVVGARFDNPRRKGQPTGNRQTEILMCEPGEAIVLLPEPTNEHDADAIAVYSARGVRIWLPLGRQDGDRPPRRLGGAAADRNLPGGDGLGMLDQGRARA